MTRPIITPAARAHPGAAADPGEGEEDEEVEGLQGVQGEVEELARVAAWTARAYLAAVSLWYCSQVLASQRPTPPAERRGTRG